MKKKEKKEASNKIVKKEDKNFKILKYIILGLMLVFVVELVYFGFKAIKIRRETVYYGAINEIIKTESGYAAVGLGDSKHSDHYRYKRPGYNKPYIWIYNDKKEVTKEVRLDIGYNGTFTDIIEVEDGYIVIGYIEIDEYSFQNQTSEGIILKYDKDFELIWRKNLDVLGVTRFNAIEELSDGSLLVAGTSIYEQNVIGNHTTGGAIVVKYSADGEKQWIINHGGPRTGEFNDIVLANDGFIVVGVKAENTGIIFKYNYEGKELWHNYYGYCDAEGLTSITKINDKEFIITGSKLSEKDNTDNYKAAVLKYNGSGKLIKETLYQKDSITKFKNSIVINDNIYVVGLYGKKVNQVLDNDSVLITYNKDLEQIDEKVYEGNKTITITGIINVDNKYVIAGHTNSKIDTYKTNGLDYYPIFLD